MIIYAQCINGQPFASTDKAVSRAGSTATALDIPLALRRRPHDTAMKAVQAVGLLHITHLLANAGGFGGLLSALSVLYFYSTPTPEPPEPSVNPMVSSTGGSECADCIVNVLRDPKPTPLNTLWVVRVG